MEATAKLYEVAKKRDFHELSTDEKVAYIEKLLEETYHVNGEEEERDAPQPLPHERRGRDLTDDVKEEISKWRQLIFNFIKFH